MPCFDIIKQTKITDSYRVQSVVGAFDLNDAKLDEHFEGNIDIEDKQWNVGLIVGGSGTGKSTIAKEIFGNNLYSGMPHTDKPVIDDMPQGVTIQDIERMFTSVGFASPPNWLRPYSVLSNGEKMRCDLAYALLKGDDMVVYDEFTSVVNRQVAKAASFAISKCVRRNNKKFVAVSCHDDIIEWLQPDWIYNTDTKRFFFCTGEYRRPEIKLQIYEISGTDNRRAVWQIFKKYHYLNGELNPSARQFVGIFDGELVAHTAVIPMPMTRDKKRLHRSVVLPDYQGIGIGMNFKKAVCDVLRQQGWHGTIWSTTTTPAQFHAQVKSPYWRLVRYGRAKRNGGGMRKDMIERMTRSSSRQRITYSFIYLGDEGQEKI